MKEVIVNIQKSLRYRKEGYKMGLLLHTTKFQIYLRDVQSNMTTLSCYTGLRAERPIF